MSYTVHIYAKRAIPHKNTCEYNMKEVKGLKALGIKLGPKPQFEEYLIRITTVERTDCLDSDWLHAVEPLAHRYEVAR